MIEPSVRPLAAIPSAPSAATKPPWGKEITTMTAEGFALVTGASRGIGRAIALALAGRGYDLGIHYYTRQDAAEQVLAEVRDRGASGFTVSADVTQDDQVRGMIERV